MVKKKKITEALDSARKDGRLELTEHESKQIISAWEIPTTETHLATDKPSAVEAARELKYPIVMKIASPAILHKSDAGGVRVGLSSEIEVRQAFDDIIEGAKEYNPDAEIWGVSIQRYIPRGREVIIGLSQDPTFGPTLMFGLGGIWVEVLEDVSFRLAPISSEDAMEMIHEIKGYPLLSGIRGDSPADIDTLVDILKKVGELAIEFDEISEIDLNPTFVFDEGEGAVAVDARIILEEPPERKKKK